MAELPRGALRPTLSVITPSFNSGTFLEETLDSVAALRTDHEHLVIDGGSTDDTVPLLESRRDSALTWVSETDRGQTHAVNKGLERSRGALLAWLNADDAYVPQNVDDAVGFLMERPEIDAIFGWMAIVDEEGAIQKRYRCGPFSWHRYLYLGEYLPTPTIIFRRSLLERAGRLDERYVDAADYDFYLRLLRGARVRNMRAPLVRFRYHPASKSASRPAVQSEEAIKIRFGYARTPWQRLAMRASTGLMKLRGSWFPIWPQLQEKA